MHPTLSRANVGPRGTCANCCVIIADIKSLRPVSWEMALKRFLILGRTAKHQDWSLTKTSSKTKSSDAMHLGELCRLAAAAVNPWNFDMSEGDVSQSIRSAAAVLEGVTRLEMILRDICRATKALASKLTALNVVSESFSSVITVEAFGSIHHSGHHGTSTGAWILARVQNRKHAARWLPTTSFPRAVRRTV